ncbi:MULTISPECIES: FtsX-like permease family protein [unclassified Ruminococcus]|uniref:FtsX-like permease family protein n=1 Tax=unclassified Ruminococcus TaxID=2608920 RepID=UPI00210E20A6|nr:MULTISPECIES: FtsX-like permease family protein [unclassified Ruminococcus]
MPSKLLPSKENNINYFEFSINNSEDFSKLFSNDVLVSDEVADIRFYHTFENNELPKNLQDESSSYFKLSAGLISEDHIFQEKGRIEFTEEENQNGENVVILPQDYNMMAIQLGDEITLCGCKFEVIGFHAGWDQLIIPQKTMQNLNIGIDSFALYMKNGVSREESEKFISEVNSCVSVAQVISSPLEMYNAAQRQDSGIMVLLSVVYIISITSFMFLMKFMVDKSRRENIIYSIVGATKKKVVSILLAESVTITAIISFLAVFVHILFYESFFSQINTEQGIIYNANDYFLITAFMIMLSLLTSIPFVFSYMKCSIVENKNKYNL